MQRSGSYYDYSSGSMKSNSTSTYIYQTPTKSHKNESTFFTTFSLGFGLENKLFKRFIWGFQPEIRVLSNNLFLTRKYGIETMWSIGLNMGIRYVL